MQKIVIDTNVIVSSFIQRSYPFLIVSELFIEGQIQLCISEELMAEYFEVLSRPKFTRFPDFFQRANSLLTEITTKATRYFPTTTIDLISEDDDNMILELAEISNADFIITGNTNDFTLTEYNGTRIVTPKQYWDNHRP